MLLFRTKGRSLAALGAILIVLLLAIDTFFQQVVSLPDRWRAQRISGTIPRVIEYLPAFTPSYQFGGEIMVEDRNLAPVAREFFYRNGTQPVPFGNGTRPDIPLSCPTSNCTWPLYETLAVCSRCADVSDAINSTYACLNMTIEWSAAWDGPLKKVPYPNGTVCGYFLNATSPTPILLSGYVLPTDGNVTAGEALVVRLQRHLLPSSRRIDIFRKRWARKCLSQRASRCPRVYAVMVCSHYEILIWLGSIQRRDIVYLL
jgi:hypothetical protein